MTFYKGGPIPDGPAPHPCSCGRLCVRGAEARERALAEVPMVRAEIPLAVVPSRTPAERQRLGDLALLLRTLLQEEQQALQAAVTSALDRSARRPGGEEASGARAGLACLLLWQHAACCFRMRVPTGGFGSGCCHACRQARERERERARERLHLCSQQ